MCGQQPATPNYKQLDAASYDGAAAEFDRLSERFNVPLAMRMLDMARLRNNDHVLDVGTGTGLIALRAGTLAANGRVIGIDHSSGMLEQARAKVPSLRLSNVVTFMPMDAERLDFPDRFFDVVLSLYALFHFPDPLAAIREMHRVLRRGGRVVIGVGSGPSLASWNGIVQSANAVTERVAAARGRLLTAPQFLLRLMRERGVAPQDELKPGSSRMRVGQLLRQAGFGRVYQRWQGHREELDAEEFWRVQITYATEARIRLQQGSPDELAALERDFLERCRRVLGNDGKLVYRHAAMFYAGVRERD
jgi:ubiquinone/menaquinone biosynthesis C-methylase UbiE